jgi:hypothetical protein
MESSNLNARSFGFGLVGAAIVIGSFVAGLFSGDLRDYSPFRWLRGTHFESGLLSGVPIVTSPAPGPAIVVHGTIGKVESGSDKKVEIKLDVAHSRFDRTGFKLKVGDGWTETDSNGLVWPVALAHQDTPYESYITYKVRADGTTYDRIFTLHANGKTYTHAFTGGFESELGTGLVITSEADPADEDRAIVIVRYLGYLDVIPLEFG